jgi:carbonic anhydrase/acetyltransferase-like protein (isoleucine patch superfamily)
MPLISYKDKAPQIDPESYVSPNATLIGDVRVGKHSVIWPGSILRAEYAPIIIPEYCTIFDGVMMFTRSEKSPINLGNYTIIEEGATIFGCYLEDYVLISRNTLIHERSSLGEGVILLNDSVVPPGLTIPARAILTGDPVQKVREQTRNDVLKHKERAEHFSEMFIKIHQQLPHAQSYMLTFSDFMKFMLDKSKEEKLQ